MPSIQLSFLTPEVAMARRRSYRSAAPKRRLFWVRFSDFTYPGDGGGAVRASNLLESFEEEYGAQLFGFTVTRIRGSLQVWDRGNPAGGTEPLLHWASAGIRVCDDAAIEQADEDGEQASLIPQVDKHADWMWVTNKMVATEESTQYAPTPRLDMDIDVKAQRRIDELGQGLYLIYGNGDITTSYMAWTWDLSVLMKRP